jgi:hypothetical protein
MGASKRDFVEDESVADSSRFVSTGHDPSVN